ncbi:hypothetical protein FQN60_018745 [Etheostoma spectabile]|uniref:Uncharacterized protein n=1 Tax=Etheostoma spectabile TaxID=54343 RepID=A0A5J5C6Z8_9PERO|nr:hypothetical protein FQN60_006075 [Etheostoma spectabile]KAA8578227.1 hypothetical protein FQN60_018745 [Etheostoma spectabile]
MDGYDNRNVLWMEAYTTNSDQKVVASYFIMHRGLSREG